MSNKFIKITDIESWENLLTASKERPVLIFKHSNACGISSAAYREMEKLENVNFLEVQSARELSHEIEATTGVTHETPQVIVLRDGKAVWNASHSRVKADRVSEALQANS